ncbi:MAG TPA: hypothetical protein VLH56_08460 [Dissulfurispiraceae bacterium]|nr:hypothetical protein [Dissulfurispiraceae bacterium]
MEIVSVIVAGLVTIVSTVLAILKQLEVMRERRLTEVLIGSIEEAEGVGVKREVYRRSMEKGIGAEMGCRVKEVVERGVER